jgi:hypothetical protein
VHIFAHCKTQFAGPLGSDAHQYQVAKGAGRCSALESGWNEGLDSEGDEETIQCASGCACLGTPCNFVGVAIYTRNVSGLSYEVHAQVRFSEGDLSWVDPRSKRVERWPNARVVVYASTYRET